MAILGLDGLILGVGWFDFPQDVHKLQDVWELKISRIWCFLRCERGILFGGSWQMGQTRHGLMGPEILGWAFWWDLKTSRFRRIWRKFVLAQPVFLMWICVCSLESSCAWSFPPLKRSAPGFVYTLAARCINVTLHSKIKNIGNLYTKKTNDSWNYLLQNFQKTYIHPSVSTYEQGPFGITASNGDVFDQGNSRVRRWLPTVWLLRGQVSMTSEVWRSFLRVFTRQDRRFVFWGTCQLEANGPKIVNFGEILRFWL